MQRLGIRKKTLIALLGVAVPALITFSTLIITTTAHILQKRATDQISSLATRSAAGLGTLVDRSRTTLTTIVTLPEVKDYIAAVESGNNEQIAATVARAEKAFLGWQKLDPNLQAIRLIDPRGNVVAKIKEGHIIPATGPHHPPYNLKAVHSVATRDFFRAALKMPANSILISNLERGKIEEEETFCPAMVRFATPLLQKNGKAAGVVIINVWGDQAGQLINRLISQEEGSAFLVERNPADKRRNGIYLFHRDTSCEFGDQTGSCRTVFDDYPPEVTRAWFESNSGHATDPRSKDILAHAYYSPYNQPDRGWVVVVHAKRGFFMEPISTIGKLTTLWALLVVALAVLISVFFARSLTRPIQSVVEGMHRLSNHPSERLSNTSSDEVGFLAGEINRMADAIQQSAEEKLKVEEQIRNTEKLAAVGEMAAGLAHELNTPLGNIKALALLARKEVGNHHQLDPKSLEHDLGDIADQAGKCSGIIDGLLSFARKSGSTPSLCNPMDLVDEAISLVRMRAEKAGVQITVLPADGLDPLYVDMNQLRQVFVNILLNAIDASPGGEVNIELATSLNQTAISFKDNGCGIPSEIIDRIFDPFFTTKEVGQGTGLGLSVSYGIIKSMGGDILIESGAGQGSRFTVVIPSGNRIGQ
jgi:two-component system, NtrC family, sensor kinase